MEIQADLPDSLCTQVGRAGLHTGHSRPCRDQSVPLLTCPPFPLCNLCLITVTAQLSVSRATTGTGWETRLQGYNFNLV